jgi:hypothetical protein
MTREGYHRRDFLRSSAALPVVPAFADRKDTKEWDPVTYASVVDGSEVVPELCIADEDPRYHKHGKHISKPACGVDPGYQYREVMTDDAETENKLPCPLCYDESHPRTRYYWTQARGSEMAIAPLITQMQKELSEEGGSNGQMEEREEGD